MWITIVQHYKQLVITYVTCENHCANYRVGVGLLGMKWMPKPDLNISISDQYCANYRVAVDPLVGQGWELKATYPVLAVFIILQRRRCWSFSVGWVWV